jgi:uracil phosphoribosyltransferase
VNKNVFIFNHPLIDHKMTIIRNKETNIKDFKENVSEIGALITYEVTRGLKTKDVTVETPICKTVGKVLAQKIVIVPILRAGLGMVDGILQVIPTARVGHIGLYRDEKTLEPITYYQKFPKEIKDCTVLLVDPMLATGKSASRAVDILKSAGAKNVCYIGLIGAPEGVEYLSSKHSDVPIYLAALDTKLNEKGYIVPGLGDCGDRLFGTK